MESIFKQLLPTRFIADHLLTEPLLLAILWVILRDYCGFFVPPCKFRQKSKQIVKL